MVEVVSLPASSDEVLLKKMMEAMIHCSTRVSRHPYINHGLRMACKDASCCWAGQVRWGYSEFLLSPHSVNLEPCPTPVFSTVCKVSSSRGAERNGRVSIRRNGSIMQLSTEDYD